jgi:hypothetical protein
VISIFLLCVKNSGTVEGCPGRDGDGLGPEEGFRRRVDGRVVDDRDFRRLARLVSHDGHLEKHISLRKSSSSKYL